MLGRIGVLHCSLFTSVSIPPQKYMLVQEHEHELLFDLIQSMLAYEPRKRITASEALKHPFFGSLSRTIHHSLPPKRSLSSQGSSSSTETE